MGGAFDAWGRKKHYRVFVGKSEEKKPLGRPVHRNEDDIKMDVKEIGCEGMDRIHLGREG